MKFLNVFNIYIIGCIGIAALATVIITSHQNAKVDNSITVVINGISCKETQKDNTTIFNCQD